MLTLAQCGLMERHPICRTASRKATIHAACESQITVFVGDRYYDRCSTLRPIRRSTVRCDQQQHRRSASWSRSRGLLEAVGMEASKRFREFFASGHVLRSCKLYLIISNDYLKLTNSSGRWLTIQRSAKQRLQRLGRPKPRFHRRQRWLSSWSSRFHGA
jgi:hypothetical protein